MTCDIWLEVVSSPPMGVAAHGCRSQARPRAPRLGAAGEMGRWSETIVAFARLCLCGIETAVAFAGEKWGVFGAVCGCSGDAGFSGSVLGASRGVVGFNVAFSASCARNLSPWSAWCGCEREIVRPASPKRAKNAVFRRAGRVISRTSSRWILPGAACSPRGTGSWAHLLAPPLMHG